MTAAAVAVEKPARRPQSARRLHPVPDGGFLPRVAPPLPSRSAIAELRKAAKLIGRPLYSWQDIAGQYMTATKGKRWLYPELVVVVARQNGKTSLLIPRIVMGLLRGERIMHTAQDRSLPRIVFEEVAEFMEQEFRPLLKAKPRYANGTEQVRMLDGGSYRIVAPTKSGARGPSNDLVIVDEAREMDDHTFVAAAEPTLTVAASPQIIYLSNAGTEDSVVLNGLRKRAEADMSLGYIEWSAHPDRTIEDRTGWREANPALAGGVHAKAHMEYLERKLDGYRLEGTPDIFETEHLCRWVTSEMPRIVSDIAWQRAGVGVGKEHRPVLALAQDPAGRRASAAVAWKDDAGVACVYILADVDGYPVDLGALAESLQPHIRRLGIREIAFDPRTDQDIARHFPRAKPMQPMQYEAACEKFARALDSGQLRYQDDDGVLTADMAQTVRRETSHGWIAVPASSERATTASLAAIRSVWLATKPTPPTPRVY